MNDRSFAAIRHAVCAVGYATANRDEFINRGQRDLFEVVGTAFLVLPGRVMTCAHVIDDLDQAVRKRGPRPAIAALQFVYPEPGGVGWKTAFRDMSTREINREADSAILDVRDPVPTLKPVPVVDDTYVPSVGDEIAVCGYAHGSVILRKGAEVARFGPVVQRGTIAALSPYDAPTPGVAILDIVTGPAASGSPVFLTATGQVIGLLFEGQIRRSAALSAARLIRDTPAGIATSMLIRLEHIPDRGREEPR